MAIKREDLTEEQIKQLESLYKKFHLKVFLAVFLYSGFLLFANFTVIVLNALYFNNPQFYFLSVVGNTFIVILGIRGTMEEKNEELKKEVKKIVGHV